MNQDSNICSLKFLHRRNTMMSYFWVGLQDTGDTGDTGVAGDTGDTWDTGLQEI